ncbi:MAG: hypothetical protein PVI90_18280 [Desulfobacteraceae bacterium]|jgi:hypothetical protein
MPKTLGILVNSDHYFSYLLQITKAAHEKGVNTHIFFTGVGVLLSQTEEFKELVGLARLSICDVSFRSHGLSGDVPGVGFKDFVTQATHAEMIFECDRYIVL